jgi:M6 family metalloprotease-like protein
MNTRKLICGKYFKLFFTLISFLYLFSITNSAFGIVPMTDEQVKKLRKEGKIDKIIALQNSIRQKNIEIENKLKMLEGTKTLNGRTGTGTILILLCEFNDNLADKSSHGYDYYKTVFFSKNVMPGGSFRDFYNENSYNNYDVKGDASQWYLLPQNYSYYVAGNYGFGNYPENAEKLVEDLILMADADIDFSQYDNDGPDGIPNSGDDDGYVDSIFVIHAGGGGEGGDPNMIWSHASYLYHNRLTVDGVQPLRYTVCPEASPIGVYAHEYGHTLGLPDLYDTDYSSSGIGVWSIMAAGSWNNNGNTPAQFDAWSKKYLGWLEPTIVTLNQLKVSIPQIENNSIAYLLWTNGNYSNEYFLVENRQQTLYDSYLPNSGLLIWHIDDNVWDNSNENHPRVRLEQADGLNELEQADNRGNNGDPYPGSTNNRSFNDTSNPDNKDYSNKNTLVRVENISNSNPTMYADLFVSQPLNLDSKSYSCNSKVQVEIKDQLFAGLGSIKVKAKSTTEPDGESFTAIEDSENPGTFTTSIQLDNGEPSTDGKIQVNDQDIVTISFLDPNKNINYEKTATIDCQEPSAEKIQFAYPDATSIKLLITLLEDSFVSLEYGESTELGNTIDYTNEPSKTHEIILNNLKSCTIYYYKIHLKDIVGNEKVIDNNGSPLTFETRMDKVVGLTYISDDFESGNPGNWIHEGAEDEWELGTPLNGPMSAYSGNNCWGTDLDGEYNIGTDNWLITPEFDITYSNNPTLTFWHWYNIFTDHNSGDDGAWLEITTDGGNHWTHIDPVGGYTQTLDPDAPYNPSRQTEDLIGVYAGTTETWVQATFKLKNYIGNKVKLRFHIWQDYTDDKPVGEGWYIDDVKIFDDNLGICHKGQIEFLSDKPNCSFILPVSLGDNDLNQNPSEKEQVSVALNITSNSQPLNLILHESGEDTGIFFGILNFSKSGIDNTFQVQDNDLIKVEYIDLNDGTGTQTITSEETRISCITTSPRNFRGNDVPNDNGGSIEFTWNPADDDGQNENDVLMYILYRATVSILSPLSFEKIMEIPAGERSATDNKVNPQDSYQYYLQTVDLFGNTADTPHIGPLSGTDNIAPDTPTNLEAKDIMKGDSILLKWEHNVTEQTDGYLIFYGEKSGWPYTGTGAIEGNSPITIGLAKSFVISGLKPGKEYYFAVRAREYTGARSLLSNEASSSLIKVDKPIIMAAGFNTGITHFGGEVIAQVLVKEGTFPISRVGVFYKENDMRISLDESWNDGNMHIYTGNLVIQPTSDLNNNIIVEFVAFDDNDNTSDMWPYITIIDSGNQKYLRQELPNDIIISKSEFNYSKSAYTDSNPMIIIGGYWETKLDPKNPTNVVNMMVYVHYPLGQDLINSVALYNGAELSDYVFNDDGLNGDMTAGDSIYSIEIPITEYPEPGRYFLAVAALDVYNNRSNIFPFIHVR